MQHAVQTSIALVLLLTVTFLAPTTPVHADAGDPQIAVHGNADLAQQAADNAWPGSGTPSDPYIIQGYNITLHSGTGIGITSTTAHVVIRGNTVTGTGGLVYGVHVAGAHNARVENNTFHGTSLGVFVNTANDVTVRGNIVGATGYGIALLGSKRTLVEHNDIPNAQHGIAVIQAQDATLRANHVHGNTLKGIYLHNSNGALLEGNTIEANVGPGIHVLTTPGVTARDNTIRGHVEGALIETAATWTDNLVEDNRQGLVLKADGQTLRNNTFVGNDRGAYVQSSGHTFRENTYKENAEGVYLIGAHDSTFTDERTLNNTLAIHGFNALRHTFTGLRTEGDDTALFFEVSRDLQISGSHMRNHSIAVRLSGIRDSLIEHNDIAFAEDALRITTGRSNVYRHNALTENTNGLRLLASNENLVYDNRFQNTRNVEVTGQVTNTWNIDPTPGKNILGGDYVAGNAWHDYAGFDATGDGLGDLPHGLVPYGQPTFQALASMLGTPYGPEDRHPLVAPSGAPLPLPPG